jgi:hypothetical protein
MEGNNRRDHIRLENKPIIVVLKSSSSHPRRFLDTPPSLIPRLLNSSTSSIFTNFLYEMQTSRLPFPIAFFNFFDRIFFNLI